MFTHKARVPLGAPLTFAYTARIVGTYVRYQANVALPAAILRLFGRDAELPTLDRMPEAYQQVFHTVRVMLDRDDYLRRLFNSVSVDPIDRDVVPEDVELHFLREYQMELPDEITTFIAKMHNIGRMDASERAAYLAELEAGKKPTTAEQETP